MSVCTPCVFWMVTKVRKGRRASGLVVTAICEPPCEA